MDDGTLSGTGQHGERCRGNATAAAHDDVPTRPDASQALGQRKLGARQRGTDITDKNARKRNAAEHGNERAERHYGPAFGDVHFTEAHVGHRLDDVEACCKPRLTQNVVKIKKRKRKKADRRNDDRSQNRIHAEKHRTRALPRALRGIRFFSWDAVLGNRAERDDRIAAVDQRAMRTLRRGSDGEDASTDSALRLVNGKARNVELLGGALHETYESAILREA